jgi:hypothetical protein
MKPIEIKYYKQEPLSPSKNYMAQLVNYINSFHDQKWTDRDDQRMLFLIKKAQLRAKRELDKMSRPKFRKHYYELKQREDLTNE